MKHGVFLKLRALARTAALAATLLAAPAAAAAFPALQVEGPTPRAAWQNFRKACDSGEYESAAGFLDFSGVAGEPSAEQRASYARRLEIVLDRTVRIRPSALDGTPEGKAEDGLPSDVDELAVVESERGDVPVRMRRTETEDGVVLWRFTAATVGAVPDLFEEFGHGWLEDVLPGTFFEFEVLDVLLWQWFALLVQILVASALGYVVAGALMRTAGLFKGPSGEQLDKTLIALVAGPLRLLLAVLAFWAGSFALALSLAAEEAIAQVTKALAVLAVTWFLLRVVDMVSKVVHERVAGKDESAADTLVPMGRRVTKIFVFLIAAVSLIHNLGFNVAGILAGFGVGGIAVALAAQKSIENLFGGISVVADKPVEVGDFCKVGEHLGTVEDVGMRSTRIRTLDRTLVTIPNAEFSTARIENYGARDKIRIYTILQVGYDTSPDQMRWLLVELRRMLYAHPRILEDPSRVRFINFGAHSLDIELFAFADTQDWAEFLGIREDVYLRIMDIVEQSGTYFAYPSQTLYLGRDAGRDDERSAQAEKQVAGWREKGKLPLPDFTADEIAAVDDTLEFPPPGSSVGTSAGASSDTEDGSPDSEKES